MKIFTSVCVILLFGLMAQQSIAQSKTLLALSKTEHNLSVVDPSTFKVLARMPVGVDPHEVIASADGEMAYVTIYGGGAFHEINVLDLVNKKPLKSIDTRPLFGPHGIVFERNKIWFSAEGSKAVGSIDISNDKLDWSMGTGQDRTHMIYVTSDAKSIYTANMSSGSVSILTGSMFTPPNGSPAREEWTQILVPVSKGSEGFDVSPDGKELWTAASEDGMISIINLAEKKLDAKIDGKVIGANRLKFTPDGKMALVSSLRTGELTIFDVKTRTEKKRIKLGKGAAGILVDTDGSRVFVACSADNNIAVIDLKTFEVIQRFEVGGNPDGLAWAISK